MPCSCLKDSLCHRLLMCYYCLPEEERPRRKVRPGKHGVPPSAATASPPRCDLRQSQDSLSVSNGGAELRPNKSSGQLSSRRNSDYRPSEPIEPITPEVLMQWVSVILCRELVVEVNAVYRFVITQEAQPPSVYHLDLKNGAGSVGRGDPPLPPDVTLTSSLTNMQLLMSGKLSKVSAYLTGRLKVDGDKNAAYNLDKVITLVQQS